MEINHDYYDDKPHKPKDPKAGLLNADELKEAIDQIKKDELAGEEGYPILEIQPDNLRKVKTYKRALWGFNVPFCIAIPIVVHSGILSTYNPAKAEIVCYLLNLADFMFFFNSIMFYNVIKTVVKSVHYLPEENKLVIKQFSAKFLDLETHKYDPKSLILHRRKSLNPFIGYKSVEEDGR